MPLPISLISRTSISISPSRYQRSQWDKRHGFLPMVPKLDMGLSHNLTKRDLLERSPFPDEPFYEWTSHTLSTTSSLYHDGYGLFFIPYLDFDQRVNFKLSYHNLIPPTNAEGRYQTLDLPPLTTGKHSIQSPGYAPRLQLQFVCKATAMGLRGVSL